MPKANLPQEDDESPGCFPGKVRVVRSVRLLKDPEASFVSLVSHPANQRPFRVVKSDSASGVTTPPHTMKKPIKKGTGAAKTPIAKKAKGVPERTKKSQAASVKLAPDSPGVAFQAIKFDKKQFKTRKSVEKSLADEGLEYRRIDETETHFIIPGVAKSALTGVQVCEGHAPGVTYALGVLKTADEQSVDTEESTMPKKRGKGKGKAVAKADDDDADDDSDDDSDEDDADDDSDEDEDEGSDDSEEDADDSEEDEDESEDDDSDGDDESEEDEDEDSDSEEDEDADDSDEEDEDADEEDSDDEDSEDSDEDADEDSDEDEEGDESEDEEDDEEEPTSKGVKRNKKRDPRSGARSWSSISSNRTPKPKKPLMKGADEDEDEDEDEGDVSKGGSVDGKKLSPEQRKAAKAKFRKHWTTVKKPKVKKGEREFTVDSADAVRKYDYFSARGSKTTNLKDTLASGGKSIPGMETIQEMLSVTCRNIIEAADAADIPDLLRAAFADSGELAVRLAGVFINDKKSDDRELALQFFGSPESAEDDGEGVSKSDDDADESDEDDEDEAPGEVSSASVKALVRKNEELERRLNDIEKIRKPGGRQSRQSLAEASEVGAASTVAKSDDDDEDEEEEQVQKAENREFSRRMLASNLGLC